MWQDPLSVRFLLARLLTAGVSRPGACRTPLGLNLKLLRPPPHLVQPVALFLRPVWDAREAWCLRAALTSR